MVEQHMDHLRFQIIFLLSFGAVSHVLQSLRIILPGTKCLVDKVWMNGAPITAPQKSRENRGPQTVQQSLKIDKIRNVFKEGDESY